MYLFDLLHTMINLLFDITNIIISNSSFPIIPANFLHYVLKTIISVSSISDFLITTYIMTTKPKCSYHDYNDYDNVTVSIKKYKKIVVVYVHVSIHLIYLNIYVLACLC